MLWFHLDSCTDPNRVPKPKSELQQGQDKSGKESENNLGIWNHSKILVFFLIYFYIENMMISVEKRTHKKISECQMGIEPTTFRTLVGCSNHWATGNSNGEQWSFMGYVTQRLHRASHIMSLNTHTFILYTKFKMHELAWSTTLQALSQPNTWRRSSYLGNAIDWSKNVIGESWQHGNQLQTVIDCWHFKCNRRFAWWRHLTQYNYQNPSVFLFLMLIRAIVI